MRTKQQKAIAEDFLKLIVAGKIDEAYSKHVDFSGKHHNVFTPAGFAALQKGMKDNDAEFPDKRLVIKHLLSEDDVAVVHSQLIIKPKEMEMITVHIFQFKNDKIIELWDCAQIVDATKINSDGAF